MKSVLTWIVLCTGGAALFGASFVGFARLGGAPLSGVPLLGRFVPADANAAETKAEASAEPEAASDDERDVGEERAARRGAALASGDVLGAFLVPSPFTTAELDELQRELHTSLAESRDRLARIEAREAELVEWERSLTERRDELAALQASIEKATLELDVRRSEAASAERARSEQEAKSWAELARFFAEGDPEELATKLAQIEPAKAARILRALDEERASALVNALPAEKFQAYLEAYRMARP